MFFKNKILLLTVPWTHWVTYKSFIAIVRMVWEPIPDRHAHTHRQIDTDIQTNWILWYNITSFCTPWVHLRIMRYKILFLAVFFHCRCLLRNCIFQDRVVVLGQVFKGPSIIKLQNLTQNLGNEIRSRGFTKKGSSIW